MATGKVDLCSSRVTSWMRAVRSWLVTTLASTSEPMPKTWICLPSTGFQMAAWGPAIARLARLPVMLTMMDRVITVPGFTGSGLYDATAKLLGCVLISGIKKRFT